VRPHNLQVIAIVCDNASNNDTLIAAIERRCQDPKMNIPFNAAWARIRCMPHILHLGATEVRRINTHYVPYTEHCIRQILEAIDAMSHEDAAAAGQSYQDTVNACGTVLSDTDEEDLDLAAIDTLAQNLDVRALGSVGAAVYKVCHD
jgi:hypothetical protein